jgi:RNA polymerase sigma-70 factor (ECF subfamily)
MLLSLTVPRARIFVKGSSVIPGSSLPGSTSTGLLARLRSHDKDAWSRLARLYGPMVYSWCRHRNVQPDDAADVVQEVFRAVLGHVQDFVHGPGSTFRGWLWTITRNKILDHHRRDRRRPEALGGTDAQERLNQVPEALEESEPGSSTSRNLVRRALEMIRPDFTDATWQAFWRVTMEDQPPEEVARTLGLSVNAVYIAKSRVLRRLRDELAP